MAIQSTTSRNQFQSARLRLWTLSILLLAASLAWPQGLGSQEPAAPPPPSRRDNFKETVQGVEIADPYRWLEDQQSPQTRAWIDAQNRYTRSLLDAWPGGEALRRRLSELMRVETIGLPVVRNGRYFFKKRAAELDQGILYVRRGLDGTDEALIDPNPMSPDHSTGVNLAGVSEDGALIAYSIRHGGEDEASIHFLTVDARGELPDRLPKARYFGVALKPDKSGLFYSRHDTDGPRVYYHAFGSDPASDKQIFGKGYGPDKIIAFQPFGGRPLFDHPRSLWGGWG